MQDPHQGKRRSPEEDILRRRRRSTSSGKPQDIVEIHSSLKPGEREILMSREAGSRSRKKRKTRIVYPGQPAVTRGVHTKNQNNLKAFSLFGRRGLQTGASNLRRTACCRGQLGLATGSASLVTATTGTSVVFAATSARMLPNFMIWRKRAASFITLAA